MEDLGPRNAKREAIGRIMNLGAKRPRASTHEPLGRAREICKLVPDSETPDVDESAEDDGASIQQAHELDPDRATPNVGEGAENLDSHASLMEREDLIYALDMLKIAAEARGVTRKNIPWNTFSSIYLCNFNADVRSKLAVDSVKEIGKGSWEEREFWNRLRKVLSSKVLHGLKLFYSGRKTLSKVDKGKPSQPDFVLHVGEKQPSWTDVELLFEHTQSSEAVTLKFFQWLRNAWSVFDHQPFRRHLYGIMFIQPCAYICYADHGGAMYSEPLCFVDNSEHTQFLISFLSGFIANPGRRGRDPTVEKKDNKVYIRHAGKRWFELPQGLLWYRPSLVGRHIRVALVKPEEGEFPDHRVVMKSTWEEKIPPESSPPPEAEVLSILNSEVRGLPQVYDLDCAIVRDDGNLEVETSSFPENCEVALPVPTKRLMEKMGTSYVSAHTSKYWVPSLSGASLVPQLEVCRRLTRIIMSYCDPLKYAMRNMGPKRLMRIIRDAMIVYYEAYKLPEHGFIHGDISIDNIMVPVEGTKLTGGLTYEDRCGTIVDWNLCFTSDGTSSNRSFRSGTPAFMAPVLLQDEKLARRTLGHDMESFFAVIIWIASLDYANEDAFRAKPLALLLDNTKSAIDIVNAKMHWFSTTRKWFKRQIVEHLEPLYRDDSRFITCISDLREFLYGDDRLDNEEIEATDTEEDLFRTCMMKIDDYLKEEKGCKEMRWIDSQAQASRTPASEGLV